MIRSLLMVVALGGLGCSHDLDRLIASDDGGAPPDANRDGGALDAPSDAAGDGPRTDAPAPAEQSPVSASVGPVAGGATVCDEDGIRARGGAAAGLARFDDTSTTSIDGVTVSACVKADFGSVEAFSELLVVASASPSACGTMCMDPLCGTGRTIVWFTSADDVTYGPHGPLMPTGVFADFHVPTDAPYRYALVCRSTNAAARDQNLVDYVAAIRP